MTPSEIKDHVTKILQDSTHPEAPKILQHYNEGYITIDESVLGRERNKVLADADLMAAITQAAENPDYLVFHTIEQGISHTVQARMIPYFKKSQ